MSLRQKLHLFLDEGVALIREARGYIRTLHERRPPDLYGPHGTEIRRDWGSPLAVPPGVGPVNLGTHPVGPGRTFEGP